MTQDARYIRWFKESKIEDIPIVGGKNAGYPVPERAVEKALAREAEVPGG